MKKLLPLLTIFLMLSTQAQITLDFSMPPTNLYSPDIYKVSFTRYGDKYWTQNFNSDSVTIYNTDGTIFKQLYVPSGAFCFSTSVFYLSDNLFNTDSLIEFLFVPCGSGTIRVINEQGTIIWTSPDTTVQTGNNGWGYSNGFPQVLEMENSFKLTYSAGNGSRVFSLPGSLPCNQCEIGTGIAEVSAVNEGASMLAYPNPFSHSLTIEYILQSQKQARLQLTGIDGREIKNFELNNPTGKLTFDTNDLPKGIIIATLYDENQNLISKKLLKIE